MTLHYWFLRNHRLFNRLPDADIIHLCAVSQYHSLKKDSIIYSYPQEKDRLYILNQGRIKIAYCMQPDVEVVSEILIEGDIFGELTLGKSVNLNAEFAQVLSDEASLCSFGLEEFKHVLSNKSDLAVVFSKMVADKLKIITRKYCDLVFKNVEARVRNFFMLHAKYEGKWTGNKVEIKMLCTHHDIACFTASTRQTVSTIINQLIKERKIIYEGRSRVIIPDINKL
jgi:CRP/FNR family transcriptional regulator, cyclic AMP receptor protein